ncbi:hypothetical protein [Bacillus sp. 03113]|uniref:hypothetical protein n=1 Tax=Bacillus sp. 03113 TaxID=2578211 RepID=UPI0015E8BD2C|nr:hypothetical protein [Bacillus sp. 03113]
MSEYKELQIIKHALQHYVKRPDASKKDINQEKRVLDKVMIRVDSLKEQYGIK